MAKTINLYTYIYLTWKIDRRAVVWSFHNSTFHMPRCARYTSEASVVKEAKIKWTKRFVCEWVRVCDSTYLVTGIGGCLLIKINDSTDFPHPITATRDARRSLFSPRIILLSRQQQQQKRAATTQNEHASIDFLMVYCPYKGIKYHSTTYWRRQFLCRYHSKIKNEKKKARTLWKYRC